MADETRVGFLLTSPKPRDAIHIAVAPVVAAERLYPGQHIGLAGIGEDVELVSTRSSRKLGIVDPFLRHHVEVGQRFWMFLYPNTISSLKHVWTHPDFGDPLPAPEPEPQVIEVNATDAQKAASEAWLREFIEGADCPNYDYVIAAVTHAGNPDEYWNTVIDEDYFHFNGYDARGTIPPQFWDHIEVVTGRKVEHRPKYFSCSC